jgi:hypothetical protein
VDHKEFDELVARLASSTSRRDTVRGLVGGALGAAGMTAFDDDDAEAKRKGQGKKRGAKSQGAKAEDKKKKKKKRRRCRGGTTKCGGSRRRPNCVDLSTDESNCGSCFNACSSTQVCSNGTCVSAS